jgi:hypothetical protein
LFGWFVWFLTEDDVKGGTDKIRRALLELFFKLTQQVEQEGGDPNILFDVFKHSAPPTTTNTATNKETKKIIIPLVEADDNFL